MSEVEDALKWAEDVCTNACSKESALGRGRILAAEVRRLRIELIAVKEENEALRSNDVVAAPYRHLACKKTIEDQRTALESERAKVEMLDAERKKAEAERDRLKKELEVADPEWLNADRDNWRIEAQRHEAEIKRLEAHNEDLEHDAQIHGSRVAELAKENAELKQNPEGYWRGQWALEAQESAKCRGQVSQLEKKLAKAVKIVAGLAGIDPVYGPVRVQEPRKNPLDMEEKPIYTFRRICVLCRRRSEHNGENVTHTKKCPWIPAKALSASAPQAKEAA